MRRLEHIYTNRFFKSREDRFAWRAPILVSAVVKVLSPKSAIDVGAAIGDVVKCFNQQGVDAVGLEGSEKAKKYLVCDPYNMIFVDLRKVAKFNRIFDLCTCFEVAEHIEEEFVDQFIKNLVSYSDKILISICNNGGGRHHVNLKPMEYWDDLFAKEGYCPREEVCFQIKEELKPHSGKPWLKMIIDRLHYYEKGKP